MFCPEWMDIVDCNWSFTILAIFLAGTFSTVSLVPSSFSTSSVTASFINVSRTVSFFCNFFLRNLLSLFTRIFVSYKDWNRHERAVLIKNFFSFIFVGKFIAVLIEVKSNLSTRRVVLVPSLISYSVPPSHDQ